MRNIAPGTGLIDLCFQGHPDYIGAYVLEAGGELLVVDPGPASTLDQLEQGLRLAGHSLTAITGLLLTHIHLDHAGASGCLVRDNPRLKVYVHQRGARHLIDPGRLLASATRLYGDRMQQLWGEFVAVPEANVVPLSGGETLSLGTRELQVAYTPGHAVHHLSYFDLATGLAFVGDVAGIRIDNRPYVLPVTPPPDIDIEAWDESIERIAAWAPAVLCPTHFGPARPPMAHLQEHQARLHEWVLQVARDLASGRPDEQSAADFAQRGAEDMQQYLQPVAIREYLAGGGLRDSWYGLARYLRKRARRAGSEGEATT